MQQPYNDMISHATMPEYNSGRLVYWQLESCRSRKTTCFSLCLRQWLPSHWHFGSCNQLRENTGPSSCINTTPLTLFLSSKRSGNRSFTPCMSHFQVLATFIQLYDMQSCIFLDMMQKYLYFVFLFNFTGAVSKEFGTLKKVKSSRVTHVKAWQVKETEFFFLEHGC